MGSLLSNNIVSKLLLNNNADACIIWISDTLAEPIMSIKISHVKLKEYQPIPTVSTGPSPIVVEKVTSEKDLGVTFDQKLKFIEHINNNINKANRNVGLI